MTTAELNVIEQDAKQLKALLKEAQDKLRAAKKAKAHKAAFSLKLGVMGENGYGFERQEFESMPEAIAAMTQAVESKRPGLREVLLVVRG